MSQQYDLHHLPGAVAAITPRTPRNDFDRVGYALLALAGLAFLLGGAMNSRGRS